jgi:hypothetical protein
VVRLADRLPWFVAVPLVLGAAAAAAWFSHVYAGPLFHEECENQRNLLTGEIEASNCGEGAKVRAGADGGQRTPSAGDPTKPGIPDPAAPATPTPANGGNPGTPPTSDADNPDEPLATPAPTDAPADPTPPPSTPDVPAAGPGVLATGELRDGAPGHHGSGEVEVQRLTDGSLNLFLKGFSVTNGPDLFVVITRDPGGDYADGDLLLGRLTANNGSLNYTIPDNTEIGGWGAVVIWCRQFDVTFAYAPLGGGQ